MSRCIVVIAVLLISISGSSYAQRSGPSDMPEKVQESLEKLIGTWNAIGFTEGKAEFRWNLSKNVLIGRIEFETEDTPLVFTSLWYWDKKSEDGVITSRTLYNDLGVTNTEFRGKVLPGGIIEGKQIGEGLSDNLRIEHQSPNQFTIFATNIVEDGERVPDFAVVFTRIDSTGRGEKTSTEQVLARNKEQVKRFYDEVVGKMDLSKAHEILSPKMILNGRTLKDGPIEFYRGVFKMAEKHFGKIEVIEDHMVAEGNWVARRYRLELNYYPGGKTGEDAYIAKVKINGMGFYEFDENGLIIQNRHIEDTDKKLARIDAEYAEKKQ